MTVIKRFVATLFVAIAAFLVYAVVHAVASPGGARWGVCAGYIAAAAVLTLIAVRLWRRRPDTPAPPVPA
jgi:multisubunit Na+/H+ antiporter MnhB subunit